MTAIKSPIRRPNIRKVLEDFVNKRGCVHFLSCYRKKVNDILSYSSPFPPFCPEVQFISPPQYSDSHIPTNLPTASRDLYLIFLRLLSCFFPPLPSVFCLPLSIFYQQYQNFNFTVNNNQPALNRWSAPSSLK